MMFAIRKPSAKKRAKKFDMDTFRWLLGRNHVMRNIRESRRARAASNFIYSKVS